MLLYNQHFVWSVPYIGSMLFGFDCIKDKQNTNNNLHTFILYCTKWNGTLAYYAIYSMHYNDIVGWLWQADPISGKEWSMSTGLEKYSCMYL